MRKHERRKQTGEKKVSSVPDIPDLRQPERVSTDRDLGPRVPTILVNAGKKLCEKYIERDQ